MTIKLSRRQLLAGAAAAGILAPFVRPNRKVRAAGDPKKCKAMFVYVPDGCIPSLWHPTGSENDFRLNRMTAPLAEVQQHLVFLKGLDMYAGGATHEGGVRKILTGTAPVSLDVFLGQQLNREDQLDHASLQLGVGTNFQNGSGGMSFIGVEQEVKPDDNPLNAFTRIFGAAPGGGAPPANDPAVARRTTILDVAASDITRARSRLGSYEKDKLDIHLESFQNLERRLTQPPVAQCSNVALDLRGYANNPNDYYPKTYEKEENFQRVGELQMDIATLALACQKTRVVSLMWSHPVSPTRIPGGGSIANHDSSHYGAPGSATAEAFVANKIWFMQRFAYLIDKLARTPDPDGGMLIENTVVFLSSELGDSNNHDHKNMPFLLAGQAVTNLRTNRLLDYTGSANGQNQPHSKLLVSIAKLMGVNVNEYGFTGLGTGGLPGLV